jgi:hypothetical protein
MSKPIALGIIGFGIMGERLLRAALEHAAGSVTPVAVWDPAPDAAARLAAISPAVPMLASAAAVIAACDCLYVAAPPAAHIPLAEAAIAAGRAVFLEKPLATDLAIARAFVAREVTDPVKREKLMPATTAGCKRNVRSGRFLKALDRPDVEIVTDPIDRFTPEGLLTRDGVLHELDAVIYGTGFAASQYLSTFDVIGPEGKNLRETWGDAAEAYLGVTVAGYPNFFMIYGPNTNAQSSIIFIIDTISTCSIIFTIFIIFMIISITSIIFIIFEIAIIAVISISFIIVDNSIIATIAIITIIWITIIIFFIIAVIFIIGIIIFDDN